MVATRELLESLREQVRRIETAGRPNGQSVSLGCSALDALLPERGMARGTIHEWLAPRGGSGAEILSLIAAREACRDGGALAVIDWHGCFYPPAAALWGIGLENTIVIRPESRRDAAWAIDQALRCSAVAAVWGFVDLIGERWLRRFQLSAEQSGCLGLFVRPGAAASQPTWSESRWLCRGVARRGIRSFASTALAKPVAHKFDMGAARENHVSTTNGKLPAPQTSPQVGGSRSLDCALVNSRQSQFSLQAGENRREDIRITRAGEDRLVQVSLARLRGGAAGASVTLRIDFQSGSVQLARRDHEADCVRLSERLANPTLGRRAARA
jgi:hypothetical protein